MPGKSKRGHANGGRPRRLTDGVCEEGPFDPHRANSIFSRLGPRPTERMQTDNSGGSGGGSGGRYASRGACVKELSPLTEPVEGEVRYGFRTSAGAAVAAAAAAAVAEAATTAVAAVPAVAAATMPPAAAVELLS